MDVKEDKNIKIKKNKRDQHTFVSVRVRRGNEIVVRTDTFSSELKFLYRTSTVAFVRGCMCLYGVVETLQGKYVRQDDDFFACIFARRKLSALHHLH